MKASELRIGNFVYDSLHPERDCTIIRINSGIDYPITYHYSKSFEHTPYQAECLEGIPLTEEWLLKFGFEKKPAYQWHGNGFDYQIPAQEGGSTTSFRDFVLYLKNDDSFIVRFTSYRWHVYNEDKSISFHLCEWHEKCHEEIICFDTSKVHCLQNAFHLSTGEELEPKKA